MIANTTLYAVALIASSTVLFLFGESTGAYAFACIEAAVGTIGLFIGYAPSPSASASPANRKG